MANNWQPTGPGYLLTGYAAPPPTQRESALFENNVISPAGASHNHEAFRTTFLTAANAAIGRTIGQGSGIAHFNNWQQGFMPSPQAYEEIQIFNISVATSMSRMFALTVRNLYYFRGAFFLTLIVG